MLEPLEDYRQYDVGYPYRLRGPSLQVGNTGLIVLQSELPGPPTSYQGIMLLNGVLHNRSGGSVVIGIGVRIPNAYWLFGQWVDATTTWTNDTADAQSAGTDDVALETLTNNDGYVILSTVPFNAISLDISTASVTTTPVRAISYSNAAGTGWSDYGTNYYIFDAAGAQYAATGTTAANESLVVFNRPLDWGLSSSLGTGIPDGYYALRVRATTSPTGTAGKADSIAIFRMFSLTENLADNSYVSLDFGGDGGFPLCAYDAKNIPVGDALVALFSTANIGNRVTVCVGRIR